MRLAAAHLQRNIGHSPNIFHGLFQYNLSQYGNPKDNREKYKALEWKKIAKFLEKGGSIWEVHFFASEVDPPRAAQTAFYKMLSEELKFVTHISQAKKRNIECRSCGQQWHAVVEKGVDVSLATKLLTLAFTGAFETAIIMSGDGDFEQCVRFLRDRAVKVELVAWRGTVSPTLTAFNLPVTYIDDHISELTVDWAKRKEPAPEETGD